MFPPAVVLNPSLPFLFALFLSRSLPEIHTDTGDRFIYDGQSRQWLPFVGVEDVVGALSEIEGVLHDLLREAKVTRAATATMANDQSGGDYTTDDE